uniref:Uncharacterized protein n=1 Tax=Anguilla anguilla TaxID=7936 RepID=A0A0E9TRJ5_ANGAN
MYNNMCRWKLIIKTAQHMFILEVQPSL